MRPGSPVLAEEVELKAGLEATVGIHDFIARALGSHVGP